MYTAESDNELNFNQAYEVNTCMAFLKITHEVKVLLTFSRLLGKRRSLSHMNYLKIISKLTNTFQKKLIYFSVLSLYSLCKV